MHELDGAQGSGFTKLLALGGIGSCIQVFQVGSVLAMSPLLKALTAPGSTWSRIGY